MGTRVPAQDNCRTQTSRYESVLGRSRQRSFGGGNFLNQSEAQPRVGDAVFLADFPDLKPKQVCYEKQGDAGQTGQQQLIE